MENTSHRGRLLIASFLTLVAAGAGTATRGAAAGAWAKDFNIGQDDFGTIMGLGFLGFGIVIFVGGILVEMFGYKKLLMLAVIMQLVSAAMLFMAPSLYEGWVESDSENATANVIRLLQISVLLFAICNGLYEAVINPLVAQLYPENQTHYLNILHAGWPGGLILGGLTAAAFQNETAWVTEIPWHYALSSYSIVLIILGLMVVGEKFPATVSASGKSSFGVLFSCFVSLPFLVLLVLHAMIGYMELGVDSWQTRLMENLVENSVVVLIYTSVLMFVLRFFAGPIVHRLNPIGLLLASSVIAVLGLLWLGMETTSVAMIFAAATLYSLGKAFLWPTMLAVAGERYPQSGSVAMSALGAAGMISVGTIGGTMIGAQQSEQMSVALEEAAPETYQRYTSGVENDFLGYKYRGLDPGLQQAAMEGHRAQKADNQEEVAAKREAAVETVSKNASLSDEEITARQEAISANFDADSAAVSKAYDTGSRQALVMTAMVPVGMAVGFLILALYYKAIGGYKVIRLDDDDSDAASGDEQPAAAAE